MKVQILYTQDTERGRELLTAFGNNQMPTISDLRNHYTVVWEGKGDLLHYKLPTLDDFFRIFNDADLETPNPLATPAQQEMLKLKNASHTSMSTGDIVVIDGTAYLCQPMGWAEMKWEEK